MKLVPDAVTALAFSAAVAAIIWAIKGRILAPRTGGRMLAVIYPGAGDAAEQLRRWLEWIAKSGAALDVAVISDGMTGEELRRAGLLTEKFGGRLVSERELQQMIGDRKCQTRNT